MEVSKHLATYLHTLWKYISNRKCISIEYINKKSYTKHKKGENKNGK